MKLKTWLLLSYFIVMLLPLVAAYFLFAWIQSYNDGQKVMEYFQASSELENIRNVLDDPSLYHPKKNFKKVGQLTGQHVSIELYNADGFVLFHSKPSFAAPSLIGKKELYENLYSLKQGYRTYSYKQPVFEDNRLVGFYKVNIARDEWVSGVSNRTSFMFVIFISLFLLIYLIVAMLVNKKLNQRLGSLMNEMTAFANGETLEETPTNKDEIGVLQKHFYDMRKQINTAREAIEKEQSMKEYMIATISHDLKTPLTSIRAYAESLDERQALSREEQKEYRDIIVEKANFMKQMLDDLLTYTLLQSPTYEMELVPVEGDEFFEMLVSDYEPLCKEKGIILHTYCEVNGTYEVNPKQMIRVANNLMSNAIQHTDHGHQIWLAALSDGSLSPDWLFDFVKKELSSHAGDDVYFIVQNEGSGIAKEKITHIFDPLYQADQARSKKEARGTGLGLSITKQIIEKHGGNIQMFSEENRGACVVCRLPKRENVGECVETR
ncbi:sensor histidine kinase [Pueribacillus theae]|uniref:histidine kinase n=1 Tax=Pueribacillus theae TaxID=2171751 RepID=A0A2U1K4R3_9BACI|nr:HAMP domain-containing sensor histidine kinase [Pueribacillus theae]PWA12184.1 sensor histidine kinase [Pueribacillus theae]